MSMSTATARNASLEPASFTPETIGELVAGTPALRVHVDCPVNTILTLMGQSNTPVAAVVGRDDHLHGFITRSDLFKKLIIGQGVDMGLGIDTNELKVMTAQDVMLTSPAFLLSELSLRDALEIMGESGFHYMPVLGDDARLVGIADMRDVVAAEREVSRSLDGGKDELLSYLMHRETALDVIAL